MDSEFFITFCFGFFFGAIIALIPSLNEKSNIQRELNHVTEQAEIMVSEISRRDTFMIGQDFMWYQGKYVKIENPQKKEK